MADKKKYVKVGAVLEGQYGLFGVLGNTKAKDSKYNYDVKIQVKDAQGTKTVDLVNARLILRDPREKNKFASKIPKALKYDIIVQVDEE